MTLESVTPYYNTLLSSVLRLLDNLQFCVIYKCRNNNSMHRDDTIAMLAGIVLNAGKGHTVDLNKPDLAVCVEIVKV